MTIGLWVGFIAALFILLHIPTCNKHWATKLKPFSNYMQKHHVLTLDIATVFAIAHVVLTLIGLIFGVWI